MPSGLMALLDDVAGIAKLAAASIDDVGAAAGRASTKAAGVVIDDAAVTPRYVTGLSPTRELPIIGKIALGSIRNKLLLILPVALLLSSFAPWALTPILMCGGAYLCFEGAEKLMEMFGGPAHDGAAPVTGDPAALEAATVSGAVTTRPSARASRAVAGLSPTSTMRAWPAASSRAIMATPRNRSKKCVSTSPSMPGVPSWSPSEARNLIRQPCGVSSRVTTANARSIPRSRCWATRPNAQVPSSSSGTAPDVL